MEIFD